MSCSESVDGPLLRSKGNTPKAATQPKEGGGEGGLIVDSLLFSAEGLLAKGSAHVSPVGHLDHRVGDAIDVSGVIKAASAQLATCGVAGVVLDELSAFELSAVAFGLLRIGHQSRN